MFTSYLFVIGQFVLKVISYWLTANNRKLINFLSTQFFNLRKCIESIFEEHFNWNDSNNHHANYHIVLKSIYDYVHNNFQSTCTFTMYYPYHFQQHCNFEKAISVKIGTRSVHVDNRKKISEVSQVISGFVMPHLLHYSVTLYLLHLQICLLGNTLVPISSHPARSQNGV